MNQRWAQWPRGGYYAVVFHWWRRGDRLIYHRPRRLRTACGLDYGSRDFVPIEHLQRLRAWPCQRCLAAGG